MLQQTDPARLGLSQAGLARIRSAIQQRVDARAFPGAVMILARRGDIALFDAFGYRNRDSDAMMERDTIFRIASMTKPMTSLAAMMLVERGDLVLGDPLSAYLPGFANPSVAVVSAGGAVERVPARREPTILDLLRHTSGFTSGWFGTSPVKQLYRQQGLDWFEGTSAEYLTRLAGLPLESQPGSTWTYSEATEVLGLVIETVSGMGLDDVFARDITGPLGMQDTGFWVDPARAHRIAETQTDPTTGERPWQPDVTRAPPRNRGGGGLVSTAMDYARFCQFWLNQGTLDGVRLVSRKTVELMTADHLPPDVAFDPDVVALFGPRLPSSEYGRGFGLGFSVRTSLGRAAWHGSVGAYEWVGASGCVFLIDPVEELFAVLLMQAPDQLVPNMSLIRALTYQAIND